MGWIALGRGEGELSGDLGFLQRVETLGKIVGSALGAALLGDEASVYLALFVQAAPSSSKPSAALSH